MTVCNYKYTYLIAILSVVLLLGSCSVRSGSESSIAAIDSIVVICALPDIPKIDSLFKDLNKSLLRSKINWQRFKQADLNLYRSATISGSCIKLDSIVFQVTKLALGNKGHVISSIVRKNEHTYTAASTDRDSIILTHNFILEAKITLALPNYLLDTILLGLRSFPINVKYNSVIQKEQISKWLASIDETKLKNEFMKSESPIKSHNTNKGFQNIHSGILSDSISVLWLDDYRADDEAEIMASEHNILALDKRVKWAVVSIDLIGEPQSVITTVADLSDSRK